MNKIRTDKQLERLNFLLTFKSKEEIADMLIDFEEKIDKSIDKINSYNAKGYSRYDENEIEIDLIEEIWNILGGQNEENE